jgi:phosphonate degradation associated HDIG domain protein
MTTTTLDRSTIVPFLARVFAERGAEEYLGEPVTIAEHMLQGAMLAEKEEAGDELVSAALLHDIGHFTGAFGTYSPGDTEDRHHDEEGARLLAPFFPPLIVQCVRLHVAAKRYLCATDAGYFALLSEASVRSLELQGGPLNPAETVDFRSVPYAEDAIRVRRWDEMAKTPGRATPHLGHFRATLIAALAG